MASGRELLAIGTAALRWAQADAQRKDVRRRIQALLAVAERTRDQELLLADLRVLLRRCGAQAAGYRRGLVSACGPALVKRVGLPHIRSALDLTAAWADDLDYARDALRDALP